MDQESQQDWFLREWLAFLGKRQSSLVNELGWDKARANFVYHSKQQYRRDDVNEILSWLGIRQYELFMAPADAMRLRRLRETAREIAAETIAAEDPVPFEHAPPAGPKGKSR